MSKTLEEIKQEIAESEAKAEQSPTVEVETEEEVNEEEKSEPDYLGEDDEEEGESESLDWLDQDEEQTSSESVPLSAHIKAKRKLKDKNHDLESELEQLRKENERLKQGQPVIDKPKPKRDDFYDADDPDEAYLDALADWKLEQKQINAQKQQSEQAQKDLMAKQQQKIESDVEEHFKRAEGFIEQHGISQDVYAKAENNFRDAIKSVNEDAGDAITNTLISTIGEGSEKLMMYVGGNQQRREQLKSILTNDPTGLKAMVQLGRWQAEIESPRKRKSQAPKPSSTAKGDSSVTPSEARMKKKYDAAMKAGDGQAVFNLRQEAKKAGINTKSW